MGYSKPQSGCEDFNNWQKVGQISFVSSISVAPTFSSRGTQVIYSPILSPSQAYHVPINERVDVTIWGCKN